MRIFLLSLAILLSGCQEPPKQVPPMVYTDQELLIPLSNKDWDPIFRNGKRVYLNGRSQLVYENESAVQAVGIESIYLLRNGWIITSGKKRIPLNYALEVNNAPMNNNDFINLDFRSLDENDQSNDPG